MNRALRWAQRAVDYRSLTVAFGVVLLLLLGYVVVTNRQTTADALHAQALSRQAASRRIDILQHQLDGLYRQVAVNAQQNGAETVAIAALRRQIRQLGGVPVADQPTPSPQPQPQPQASRTPAPTRPPQPRPTPHPTPRPSHTPTPRPTCLLPVLCG